MEPGQITTGTRFKSETSAASHSRKQRLAQKPRPNLNIDTDQLSKSPRRKKNVKFSASNASRTTHQSPQDLKSGMASRLEAAIEARKKKLATDKSENLFSVSADPQIKTNASFNADKNNNNKSKQRHSIKQENSSSHVKNKESSEHGQVHPSSQQHHSLSNDIHHQSSPPKINHISSKQNKGANLGQTEVRNLRNNIIAEKSENNWHINKANVGQRSHIENTKVDGPSKESSTTSHTYSQEDVSFEHSRPLLPRQRRGHERLKDIDLATPNKSNLTDPYANSFNQSSHHQQDHHQILNKTPVVGDVDQTSLKSNIDDITNEDDNETTFNSAFNSDSNSSPKDISTSHKHNLPTKQQVGMSLIPGKNFKKPNKNNSSSGQLGIAQQHMRRLHVRRNIAGNVGDDEDTVVSHTEGDESVVSGSVQGGSWTGRMRARQAAEATAKAEAKQQYFKNGAITNILGVPGGYPKLDDALDDATTTGSVAPKGFNGTLSSAAFLTPQGDINEGVNELKNIMENDPPITAAFYVTSAVAAGFAAMGPVGLLLGAASVGIAAGVMQIPEEQRENVSNKAASTIRQMHVSVQKASEVLSSSCDTICHDKKVVTSPNTVDIKNITKLMSNEQKIIRAESWNGGTVDGKGDSMSLMPCDQEKNPQNVAYPNTLIPSKVLANRNVACRKKGRITPVGQIYALDHSLQTRAWIDVMASVSSTHDEKNEAMEEILILAKDRNHARMLLEFGILDALMDILRLFYQKHADKFVANQNISTEMFQDNVDFFHSRLASYCCVALGKAHCASSYDHGTVPVSRQLAQMFYEVPHHVPIPLNKNGMSFQLTEMSIQEAEDIANSIAALAEA